MVHGQGDFERLKGRQRKHQSWGFRLLLIITFISLIMYIPIFVDEMDGGQGTDITIDGSFNDWSKFTSYSDPVADVLNSDIDIIETRMCLDASCMDMFIRVDGMILEGENGEGNGLDSILVFMDTDMNADTGYLANGIGADLLIDITGYGNSILRSEMLRFEPGMDRNDWKGFSNQRSVTCRINEDTIELRAVIDEMEIGDVELFILTMDSAGQSDSSTSPFIPGMASLTASIIENDDPEILFSGDSLANSFKVVSQGEDVEILSMEFDYLGAASSTTFSGFSLFRDANGNGVTDEGLDEMISFTAIPSGGHDLGLELGQPLAISPDEEVTLILDTILTGPENGQAIGLGLADIRTSEDIHVDIKSQHRELHYFGTPQGIVVDGAFGDWESASPNIDAANDQLAPGRNNTLGMLVNRNVDIRDYRLEVNENLNMYVSVAGLAMGGAEAPVLRYRQNTSGAYTPSLSLPDSDNDGVPDIFDGTNGSLANDFNNDGIADADTDGDRDGDGITDYNYGGTDTWLNTTIPLSFDTAYSGMVVHRYLGPVKHVELKGLDYLSIYVDSDNNVSTGSYLSGKVGADYMALIAGRGNQILSGELFRYEPSGSIPWELVADVDAALDYHRMEIGMPLDLMALTPEYGFSVLVELSDWRHSADRSDDILSYLPQGTGTRSMPIYDGPDAPPPPVPEVQIDKSVDSNTAEPGDYLNYTITLSNKRKGDTAAYVWVNDTLPSGVTYVSDTSGLTPTVNGDTYTYPYTNLAGGDTVTFVITVRVDDTTADGTNLLNNVDADFTDSSGTPYGTDTDSASTDCVRPDLSIEKVANTTTAYPGTLVTYTIWYNNTGGGNAGDVWINDTIPGGTIFQSSTPAPTTVNGDDYTWYFPNVRKNTDNSITITVMVDPLATPGTTITNWASLNYTALNGHAFAEQSDSAVINVIIISEFSNILFSIVAILSVFWKCGRPP